MMKSDLGKLIKEMEDMAIDSGHPVHSLRLIHSLGKLRSHLGLSEPEELRGRAFKEKRLKRGLPLYLKNG